MLLLVFLFLFSYSLLSSEEKVENHTSAKMLSPIFP